jgi:hypothetical protein
MNGKLHYTFETKVWQHASPGGWYFVSLPDTMAKEIRQLLQSEEEGWGRLKAKAILGNSEWKTAIWFDTKRNTYLLPIKADIRKKEQCTIEKEVAVTIIL